MMMRRREGLGFSSGWGTMLSAVLAFLLAGAAQSMSLDVDEGKQACVLIEADEGNTINANYEVLTPGSLKDVMVILREQTGGVLLYRQTGTREDFFRAKADKKETYELCFLNAGKEAAALGNKEVERDVVLVGLAAEREKKKEQSDLDFSRGYFMSYDDPTATTSDDAFDFGYYEDSGFKTFGFGLRLGEDGKDIQDMIDVSESERDVAKFLKAEANLLVQALSVFNDHESYMRGREEWHRDHVAEASSRLMWFSFIEAVVLICVSWTQLSYIRRFFETKRTL